MLHGCFFPGFFRIIVKIAQQEITFMASLHFNFFYLHLFIVNDSAANRER
jgi:hypothetical protein